MHKMCVIGEADPFIARLLQRFAEESGLKTMCAKNGRELVDLVEQEKPGLIIVDVELPGTIRGWQAIIALRESSEFSHLPVITCSWLQAVEAQALVGEVSGHLQKPELHFKDFVTVLKMASIEVDQKSTQPHSERMDEKG
jgi:CheY-like chemotaxis protein